MGGVRPRAAPHGVRGTTGAATPAPPSSVHAAPMIQGGMDGKDYGGNEGGSSSSSRQESSRRSANSSSMPQAHLAGEPLVAFA